MSDTAAPSPEEQGLRSFAAILREQRHGELADDLTRQLAELVTAVREQEKAGKLTLTLTVSPGEVAGSVIVRDKVVSKPPEVKNDPSLFFPDDQGSLHRRDPRQQQIQGLRDVSAPADDDTDSAEEAI